MGAAAVHRGPPLLPLQLVAEEVVEGVVACLPQLPESLPGSMVWPEAELNGLLGLPRNEGTDAMRPRHLPWAWVLCRMVCT